MTDFVKLERDTAPGVATIRFDRPKVNAVNDEMLVAIADICGTLANDTDVRAVVLTGGERNFAAGADITAFPDFSRDEALAFSRNFNRAALALENLPQITISAINGYALGGGLEMALATDFRIAASDARLGMPEILLGIIPGGGGTQRLSRLAGITLAKDLVYSGRHMPADEALAARIISSIHTPDEVQSAAIELAGRYAAGPASLRIAKRVLLDGLHLPLGEAVELEAQGFADTFATEDKVAGVASFLEHGPGKATFTGR
ncbi:MAG: enoyl-CoA hydratase/isomerase family protein [Acidimicrobiales bacterium]